MIETNHQQRAPRGAITPVRGTIKQLNPDAGSPDTTSPNIHSMESATMTSSSTLPSKDANPTTPAKANPAPHVQPELSPVTPGMTTVPLPSAASVSTPVATVGPEPTTGALIRPDLN